VRITLDANVLGLSKQGLGGLPQFRREIASFVDGPLRHRKIASN